MSYTIREVRKDIYLVEADSLYEIASMFLRPQEFYESPFKNIRRKYFKLEEYMDTYAGLKGSFTYYEDWCGFNFSSDVFANFCETFKYDLSMKENILISLIRSMNIEIGSNFYIIGACRNFQNKVTILHEIAHAYWYLYNDYSENMDLKLKDISIDFYSLIERNLINLGYDERNIVDEIQAYLATSSRKDIIDIVGVNNLSIPIQIKHFFNAFDKSHK